MDPGGLSDMFVGISNHSLTIPKLHDDGSNWVDYESKAQMAMGSKYLIRHVDGTTRQLTPYITLNRILMSDPSTVATKDKIDAKEKKLDEYEQKEYMACHVILGTILICLSSTVKSLKSMKEMWDAVKKDGINKSKMHQVGIRHRL
jgi:hypothetical protein